MSYQFEYGTAQVGDMQVITGPQEKSELPEVLHVKLNGRKLKPTPRFWRSLFTRFRISDNTFRYFSHAEVFQRISERGACTRFRYCIERNGRGTYKLLAVSAPERPVIGYDEVHDLVKRYDGHDIQYAKGVVTSTHTPRSGDHPVQIGPDKFKNRYVLNTPIDGYGLPKIHLALLRMVCTNGMVGYSRAFRTEINVGKDIAYSIARVLDAYDNDTGYAALWQRFQSAQNSWASLRETQELYSLLIRQESARGFRGGSVIADFYEMTGRPHELYGVANLETFSVKRQRLLPAKCRVYDLINFASELATHRAEPHTALMLQAYIGGLISDEFDMEGTAEKVTEFRDFFAKPKSVRAQPSDN
jgi:hypothetical protein